MDRYTGYISNLKTRVAASLSNIFPKHKITPEDAKELRQEIIDKLTEVVGNHIFDKEKELEFREKRVQKIEESIRTFRSLVSDI